MAARCSVTSVSTSSASPSTFTPANGGSASKAMNVQRGSRRKCDSFGSPSAMTISKAPSCSRNQTGEMYGLPSFRNVCRIAGFTGTPGLPSPSVCASWHDDEFRACAPLGLTLPCVGDGVERYLFQVELNVPGDYVRDQLAVLRRKHVAGHGVHREAVDR